MNHKWLSCLCTSISATYFPWKNMSILSVYLSPYFCEGSASSRHLCFIHTCSLQGLLLEQITYLPEKLWAKLTGCLLHGLPQIDSTESYNGLDWKWPYRTSGSKSPAMSRDTFYCTTLLKAPYQLGLEYFQGGGIHHFSGQPVSVPHHPHSKECLPDT